MTVINISHLNASSGAILLLISLLLFLTSANYRAYGNNILQIFNEKYSQQMINPVHSAPAFLKLTYSKTSAR